MIKIRHEINEFENKLIKNISKNPKADDLIRL